MSGTLPTHPPIHPLTFALAQQIRGWFETLGYRFEPYEVWQDDAFEWIINIPVRRNRFDRILVRGMAGEAGLRDVQELGRSVATQQVDEGWLVTARRISRAARDEVEKPENRHLDCYTFDELVDLDADFSGYIEWLEAEIQRRAITTRYVPLACTKEEVDPVTNQRITTSRYDERDGWIDGYIDRWLDDSAKEHISVLGEFGTGKTWFAFHYAWVALQRYQAAKERGTQRPRLPLVITLRDYAKALNVENVLAGFFFTQHNIRLNSEVFDQLNRMGKLLLIFDGFDEMAAKVDKQQMINNFWELAKVVVPGAKVILTCRTEHFPEAQEGRSLLNAELQASTANLTGETPQFEVLELEKFEDDQIHQVLSFQATPATVEQVMGNPQLLDLARRPVMTELILEALPDIEAGKPVDMSRVYLYAVRRKMERDIKAERTFTSLADKLYFLCELSWEMLSTDRMSLNYREFPDRIRKLFGAAVQEEKDLDHWHYDMMGQTMLIRNAEGDYTPAHRSLLEFFVAYKFAAELGALAPDFLELAQMQTDIDETLEPKEYRWSEYFYCGIARGTGKCDESETSKISPLKNFIGEPLERLRTTIGKVPLSKAVIDLLVPFFSSFEPLENHPLMNSINVTRGKSEDEVGYVGGNVATLLGKTSRNTLENKDLSYTVILNADFTDASLRHSNFTQANLKKSTFTKALGSVLAVAASPDGELLATGDSHGVVSLWQVSSGMNIGILRGHERSVWAIAFSPDGKSLVSASDDQMLMAWDIFSGKCIRKFHGHTKWVRSLTFSSDGKILASGSGDKTIRVWDFQTGNCLHILKGHTNWVLSVASATDNRTIASGGEDKTIRIWDVQTGNCLKILEGHDGLVESVIFSEKDKLLVSGGEDRTIRIWDFQTGDCLKILRGHINWIETLALSDDDEIIASGSSDKTIRIWNLKTGVCARVLQGHNSSIRSVSFSKNSRILISGSRDQTVKLWEVDSGECFKTLQGYSSWVRSVAFSADGNTLVSGSDDRTIKIWDVSTGKCLETLWGETDWIRTVSCSSKMPVFASGGNDQEIKIWDISNNKCIKILKGHADWIRSIAFSPDGNILASGGSDQTLMLWDVRTGQNIRVLKGHTSVLLSVTFSMDGKIIATSGYDRTIKLWDVDTGKCIQTLHGHDGWIRSTAFNLTSNTLVSGGDDKNLRIWDIFSGECVKILKGHDSSISSISFNPKNEIFVSGSADKTAKIWDFSTGDCIQTLCGHSHSILSVDFSPNGNILATGSGDETIKIWDFRLGKCLKTLNNKPYFEMNITGVKGLTDAEKATLKALGAIEDVGEAT